MVRAGPVREQMVWWLRSAAPCVRWLGAGSRGSRKSPAGTSDPGPRTRATCFNFANDSIGRKHIMYYECGAGLELGKAGWPATIGVLERSGRSGSTAYQACCYT